MEAIVVVQGLLLSLLTLLAAVHEREAPRDLWCGWSLARAYDALGRRKHATKGWAGKEAGAWLLDTKATLVYWAESPFCDRVQD